METVRYVLIDQEDMEHYTIDLWKARQALASGLYIVLEIREMVMYVEETRIVLSAQTELKL